MATLTREGAFPADYEDGIEGEFLTPPDEHGKRRWRWDVSGRALDARRRRRTDGLGLPDEFWQARPVLQHIRQAAYSRQRSASAVLMGVLARVAASVPYKLRLPAIVGARQPLCFFAVFLAPPGGGKSSGKAIAKELLPLDGHPTLADDLPLGSGEGLAEILFDWVEVENDEGKKRKVKQQVRHHAFVYADEGEVLSQLAARNSSTTMSTLRSIWNGETLGQTNASQETRRIVEAGSYGFGVIVGLQEGKADWILGDADAGTPQRFAWAFAADPNIPDEPLLWPGEIDWTPGPEFGFGDIIRGRNVMSVAEPVAAEIRAADLRRNRGRSTPGDLSGHAYLLRLKIAGLLAVLDRRLDVTEDDWRLAGMVAASSDAVLGHAKEHVKVTADRRERATSERYANRQVEAESRTHAHRVVECAKRVRQKVQAKPGISKADARSSLARTWRAVFEDGLAYAEAEQWVAERVEEGQGGEKHSLHPK